MGYEITRNLISVRKIEKYSKSAITTTNFDYEEIDCDGLTIKLPKDESLYSDSDSPDILYDLLVNGGTDNIRYYDSDFHHDMKYENHFGNESRYFVCHLCILC